MLRKMKKSIIYLSLAIFVASGLFYSSLATNERNISSEDENDIKFAVETFVKEDFYFDGGKNVFSKVDNNDLKDYLIARNSYKLSNNEKNNFEVIDDTRKYDFTYESISCVDDFVKVKVNVEETNDYKMIEDDGLEHITHDAATRNDYVLYLHKVNQKGWMVSSANIDVDVDPIDGDYNVNALLGFDKDINKGTSFSKDLFNSSSNLDRNSEDTLDTAIKNIKCKEKKLMNGELDKYKVGVVNQTLDNNIDKKSEYEKCAMRGDGINRGAIYYYASLYWNKRNPNYINFRSNCTNFASQALRYAGGRPDSNHKILIDGRYRTWSLKPDSIHFKETYGDAWTQAHYLAAFMQRNINGRRGPGGYTIKYGSKLYKGDLTFLYSNKDKKWFHTYIVVAPGSNFKIAANTKDRWMVPINSCSDGHRRAYMHLVSLN